MICYKKTQLKAKYFVSIKINVKIKRFTDTHYPRHVMPTA